MFNIEIKDIIDILSVALLLYYGYKFMKESGSVKIFTGVLIFILLWLLVAQVLEMRLLGAIFDQLVKVGVIALIILFQDDVRHFLQVLGSHEKVSRLFHLLTGNKHSKVERALIVFERAIPLNDIIHTGDTIDANINQRLIENIFFKNSPLHDGAMVVCHKRITAAGCILPVSHSLDIPKKLGLRHRAALGVSQQTDALAVIVSEETGGISIAFRGEFHLKLSAEELESFLTRELN